MPSSKPPKITSGWVNIPETKYGASEQRNSLSLPVRSKTLEAPISADDEDPVKKRCKNEAKSRTRTLRRSSRHQRTPSNGFRASANGQDNLDTGAKDVSDPHQPQDLEFKHQQRDSDSQDPHHRVSAPDENDQALTHGMRPLRRTRTVLIPAAKAVQASTATTNVDLSDATTLSSTPDTTKNHADLHYSALQPTQLTATATSNIVHNALNQEASQYLDEPGPDLLANESVGTYCQDDCSINARGFFRVDHTAKYFDAREMARAVRQSNSDSTYFKDVVSRIQGSESTSFPLYYDAVKRIKEPLNCCIITETDAFFVHQSVLQHGSMLAKNLPSSLQEDSSPTIPMIYVLGEESHAFPSILEFLYSNDYSDLASTTLPQHGWTNDECNRLALHAEVFILANQYALGNLKSLSATKFSSSAIPLLRSNDIRTQLRCSTAVLRAVSHVYKCVDHIETDDFHTGVVAELFWALPSLIDLQAFYSMKAIEDAEQPHVMGKEWTEADYQMCESAIDGNRDALRDNQGLVEELLRRSKGSEVAAGERVSMGTFHFTHSAEDIMTFLTSLKADN